KPLDYPPLAYGRSGVVVPPNGSQAIPLTASDPDGEPLTYRVATGPEHGTLTGIPPNVTYRPDANYTGSDSFTFTASDRAGDGNIAPVTLNVTGRLGTPPAAPTCLAVRVISNH